ncbi:MAG: FAD-dependent oxidoreductase [Acidimicrobiales bacterium]
MASIVVIGAGLAGSATAMLLADDGHEVIVLERDASPAPSTPEAAWTAWNRRGVGQFHQAYAVQPRVTRLIEAELPEVNAGLRELGASALPWFCQLEAHFPEREALMAREDRVALTARRPVMELAFAQAMAAKKKVDVRRGIAVVGLLTGRDDPPGVPGVRGVRLEGGEEIEADLVVDATGRSSRIVARLSEIGARAPAESHSNNAAIYYTRHVRFRADRRPVYKGGPMFQNGHGIGLFCFPGDNDTWALAVWGLLDDPLLGGLRGAERFDAVVSRFPDREQWLAEGEPVSDVMPCASAADMTRRFVVDGAPVVTGLVAVGDAHAFTEPRLGRGTLYALFGATALRDTLRDHLDAEPQALARAWDERFTSAVGPHLAAANAAGRGFAAAARAAWEAPSPAVDPADRAQVLNRAFEQAAEEDLTVATWLLELAGNEILPSELLRQPGVVERVLEIGDHEPRRPRPGPTRAELADLLAT